MAINQLVPATTPTNVVIMAITITMNVINKSKFAFMSRVYLYF